jgi:signal peptidase II
LSWSENSIERVKSILLQDEKQSFPGRVFSFLVLLGVAVLVLALDQLTKAWVATSLPEGGWWSPLPGLWRVFRIAHITNSGAAFGIFPNQGNFFILIAVVVAVAIVLYYRHLPGGAWLIRVSLGLQLGGAIGNLLDRVRYGHVVDFIDIGFWPIFNLADASIVTGVAILAYYMWRQDHVTSDSVLTPADEEGKP